MSTCFFCLHGVARHDPEPSGDGRCTIKRCPCLAYVKATPDDVRAIRAAKRRARLRYVRTHRRRDASGTHGAAQETA